MDIYFILVRPAVPGNIGASARALNTMGFRNLWLVRPSDHLSIEARTFAHGSVHLLEDARIFNSLKEALAGIDFVIGTSARKKTAHFDYHPAADIIEIIRNKRNSVRTVAVVFGPEDKGLSGNEMKQCDIIAYIPMAASYPSLNLSHAVILFSYLLNPLARSSPKKKARTLTNPASYNALREKVTRLLISTGLGPDTIIYTRIMERLALLDNDDLNLVHSFCNACLNTGGNSGKNINKDTGKSRLSLTDC